MLLWIAFAFLTAAVLAAVLAPLARPARQDEAAGVAEAGTVAVYRDQLAEIEAERAARPARRRRGGGRQARDLAPAARQRRARRAPPLPGRRVRSLESRHATIALATAVAVPLLTLGLYLAHGSPGTALEPLRRTHGRRREQAALANMIAQVEARLREAPDDGKGWEVIAPVYLKLGRFRDAANAYANAARLQGETVPLLAGLAEASMLASDGIVTEEARAAYEKILKLEPGRVEPRFWLAMAKEQDGRLADALADYKALLAEAPPEAPYRPPLTMRIAGGHGPHGGRPSRRARQAGPTAADMAAAAKLDPEQRAQMIAQMVDGLAQRLKSNGKRPARLAAPAQCLRRARPQGRRARRPRRSAPQLRGRRARPRRALQRLAATLGLGS